MTFPSLCCLPKAHVMIVLGTHWRVWVKESLFLIYLVYSNLEYNFVGFMVFVGSCLA